MDIQMNQKMSIPLAQRIVNAYIRCMSRRRNYVFFGLGDLLLRGQIEYIIATHAGKIAGVCGKSYAHNVFVVSHFFAESDRLGAEFLKRACKERTLVFAVTEDLAPMLSKLGYVYVGETVQVFADEDVRKLVFASDTFVGKFIAGLVSRYGFDEALEHFESLRHKARRRTWLARLLSRDTDE